MLKDIGHHELVSVLVVINCVLCTTEATSTVSGSNVPTIATTVSTKGVDRSTQFVSLVQGSTTTGPDVCEDRVDTCSQYGRTPCTDKVYETWAKNHCAHYCGFCTPKLPALNPNVCHNKVHNCHEFDSGNLCTLDSLHAWAYDNCRGYCKFDGCNDTCSDHDGIDCLTLDATLNICNNQQKAKLLCRHYCKLCDMVDGQWSAWSSWGDCQVTCGNGTQTRGRLCNNPTPHHGGLYCNGSNLQTQPCTATPCPVHGGWGSWSNWGTCSASCDIGIEHRDRTCSNPYPTSTGNHCFGTSREDKLCFPGACKNGGWSSWGTWAACTKSCGGGVQTRSRNCNNPLPSITGKQCTGDPTQAEICNNTPCHGINGHAVGFSVKGIKEVSATGVMLFKFTNTDTDNSYNPSTGVFTCKAPGYYFFTASLTKEFNHQTSAYCLLYKNTDHELVLAYTSLGPPQVAGNTVGVANLYIHLAAGDTITLKGCTPTASWDTGQASSFSGFLVTPDAT